MWQLTDDSSWEEDEPEGSSTFHEVRKRMIHKEADGRELERPVQHTFTHEIPSFTCGDKHWEKETEMTELFTRPQDHKF